MKELGSKSPILMQQIQKKTPTTMQISSPSDAIHSPPPNRGKLILLPEQNFGRNSPVWGLHRVIHYPGFWKKKVRNKLSFAIKYSYNIGRWDFFFFHIRCILKMLITSSWQQIALRQQHMRNGSSSDSSTFTCEIPCVRILLVPVSFLLNKSTTQLLRRRRRGKKGEGQGLYFMMCIRQH